MEPGSQLVVRSRSGVDCLVHLGAVEERPGDAVAGPPAGAAGGLELDVDRPDDLLLLAEAPGETSAQKLARELCVDARLACV